MFCGWVLNLLAQAFTAQLRLTQLPGPPPWNRSEVVLEGLSLAMGGNSANEVMDMKHIYSFYVIITRSIL